MTVHPPKEQHIICCSQLKIAAAAVQAAQLSFLPSAPLVAAAAAGLASGLAACSAISFFANTRKSAAQQRGVVQQLVVMGDGGSPPQHWRTELAHTSKHTPAVETEAGQGAQQSTATRQCTDAHSQKLAPFHVDHSSTPASTMVCRVKESNHSLVGTSDSQAAKVCSLRTGGREGGCGGQRGAAERGCGVLSCTLAAVCHAHSRPLQTAGHCSSQALNHD